MLTEDQLSLITAAVDAELTPAQAKRLRQVLDASEEARAFHARLKADSDRLRLTPRAVPPAGLARKILTRIAEIDPPVPVHSTGAGGIASPAEGFTSSAPAPLVRVSSPCRRPVRAWVPAAVAAGLLLGIAAASFWFFSRPDDRAKGMARTSPRPAAARPAWSDSLPDERVRPPSAPVTPDRDPSGSVMAKKYPETDSRPVDPGTTTVAVAPDPRPAGPDFITAPPRPDVPPFDLVRVRIPFLKTLADFDREDTRQQLAEELARDPAFRIDLFTRDPARGVQLFQHAAKAAGLHVHADATTLDRLKKRQVGTVVVYTESLTADEVVALVAKLNAEDAKVSPRVFDQVHATPALAAEERSLREVLGVDVGLFKRAAGPGPGKPAEKAEKAAMLLTWVPNNARTPPANSMQLDQFLKKRGDRKPNAVPVVIVIRPGNG